MTITISGTAGAGFSVTETDDALDTGTVSQLHKIETAISALTLEAADVVASLTMTASTTAFDIDFNDLQNATGTGYTVDVVRNQDVDLTSIKALIIHNTHATNTVTVGSPAANSLFTWASTSDSIVLDPNAAMAFYYELSSEKAITTNGKINFVASAVSTTFEIYVLGK